MQYLRMREYDIDGDNMDKEAKKLKGRHGTRPLWTV
jgi:hypothetical protein